VGLVFAEFVVLTILGDFPLAGPLQQLAPPIRAGLAVALASGVTAWMIVRTAAPGAAKPALPPWRPWPPLLAHLALFAVLAWLTAVTLGPGAPPPAPGPMGLWLALLAALLLLAARSAIPLGWLGRRLSRQWGVPLLALAAGLLAWRAMAASEGLWRGLASGTLRAVAWLLGMMGQEVTFDLAERVVVLRGFEVEIAQQCAGIDGVGLTLVFQAIWIALARTRLRLGRALLLFPAGAAVALVGNAVRIAALVWLGGSGHEDFAIGAFHSKIGWVLFTFVALASVAATEHLSWLRQPEPEGEAGGLPPNAAAWVAPLVGALSTSFLAGLLGGWAAPLAYPLRIAAALLLLVLVRASLPRPLWTFSGRPALIGLGVGVLWVLLQRGDPGASAAELAALPGASRWAWIAARALGSTLVIPVAEELAFRGFLLSWLASGAVGRRERAFGLQAVLLSSLAFGALHASWWLGTLAGLAFALAYRQRGRVADAVLCHAVANGVVTLAVLIGGRWDLWR